MVVPMTRVIGVKEKSENEEDNRLHDYDTQLYTQCLLFVTMFFVMMSMAQHPLTTSLQNYCMNTRYKNNNNNSLIKLCLMLSISLLFRRLIDIY